MGRTLLVTRGNEPKRRKRDGGIAASALIASIELGAGDAWPCYWRYFFVAAVCALDADAMPWVSDDVLRRARASLLACCPPSEVPAIDNTLLVGAWSTVTSVSLPRLLSVEHRAALAPIDMDVFADVALAHGRAHLMKPQLKRLAAAIVRLYDFVPASEEALAGTEYAEYPFDNVDTNDKCRAIIRAVGAAAACREATLRIE